MYDLNTRQLGPELMDAPNVAPDAHRAALAGLRRVNRLSRAAESVWQAVRQLAKERMASQPITILDVASGGGDMIIRLKQISEKANVPVKVYGCDKSGTAVETARETAAAAKVSAEFFRHDIFQDTLSQHVDVMISNLFLHHLSGEQALDWFGKLNRSKARLVVINDLQRSVPGYWAAFIGSRILSRSHIVHFDAVQSVKNAFRAEEVLELARQSGWKKFTIRKIWPFRFQFIGIPDGS